MKPDHLGARTRRSVTLALPRRRPGDEEYNLHYYFLSVKTDGRFEASERYCERIIADDSFTYIDRNGQFTNICLLWSVDGQRSWNWSSMFMDGVPHEHEYSAQNWYGRAEDTEFLAKRSQFLRDRPLPHVYRGRVHGPELASVDYCYHLVCKDQTRNFATWENNGGWNFRKFKIGKGGWEKLCPRGTVVGNVLVQRSLHSPELGNIRDIFVYLPPSYSGSARRYPVIYMHDGQNLFDEGTSYAGEWEVDETMEMLSERGIEAIVVGVANTREGRLQEYNPFTEGGRGAQYLQFLIKTVKPAIDHAFRTQPDREHTGIVGSSMGACISLYAFLNHPEVFGFVGAMSHWMWLQDRLQPADVLRFVKETPVQKGRVYLDFGTREHLDDSVAGSGLSPQDRLRETRKLARLLRKKVEQADGEFCYIEDEGGGHSERDWARRFPGVVQFLAGTRWKSTETARYWRQSEP